MKSLEEINKELDRLRRAGEYLNFVTDSLTQKRNKIDDFASDKQTNGCVPNSQISTSEFLDLESRIYEFVSGKTDDINFVNAVGTQALVSCTTA